MSENQNNADEGKMSLAPAVIAGQEVPPDHDEEQFRIGDETAAEQEHPSEAPDFEFEKVHEGADFFGPGQDIPGHNEFGVLADPFGESPRSLADEFRMALADAAVRISGSCPQDELVGIDQGPGSPSWRGSIVRWLQRRRIRNVSEVCNVLAQAGEIFSQQAAIYEINRKKLSDNLKKDPRYLNFLDQVSATAQARGVSENHVRDLMGDPFAKEPDILNLRAAAKEMADDPLFAADFMAVEQSFSLMSNSLQDVSNGISVLSKVNKIDLSSLAKVEAVAIEIKGSIEDAPFSRPGGIRMDGEKNELKQTLEKIAATVRKIMEAIVQLVARVTGGASPSASAA